MRSLSVLVLFLVKAPKSSSTEDTCLFKIEQFLYSLYVCFSVQRFEGLTFKGDRQDINQKNYNSAYVQTRLLAAEDSFAKKVRF